MAIRPRPADSSAWPVTCALQLARGCGTFPDAWSAWLNGPPLGDGPERVSSRATCSFEISAAHLVADTSQLPVVEPGPRPRECPSSRGQSRPRPAPPHRRRRCLTRYSRTLQRTASATWDARHSKVLHAVLGASRRPLRDRPRAFEWQYDSRSNTERPTHNRGSTRGKQSAIRPTGHLDLLARTAWL